MSWFCLDDKSAFHAKVVAVGNAAWGSLVRMGAWSMDHLSDGVVPMAVVRLLATPKELAALLSVGFLSELKDGYLIHDFLDYNPSRAEVEALRATKQGAGRRGAAKRWGRGRSVAPAMAGGMAPAMALPSEIDSRTNGKPIARARAIPVPIPNPHPREETTTSKCAHEPTPGERDGGAPQAPLFLVPDEARAPDAVRQVFDHWVVSRRKALRTNAKAPRLNDVRRKKIRDRLADYSAEDLCRAIDGNLSDDWHVERGLVDVELVLRDDAHVDKFMALAPPVRPSAAPDPPRDPEVERQAMQDLELTDADINPDGSVIGVAPKIRDRLAGTVALQALDALMLKGPPK